MNLFGKRRWSPYVVGVGIGVLSWITFAFMGKALGTSTTMAKLAGAATGVVAPDHVAGNAYYGKYFAPDAGKVMFDWQFFLVLALPVGAWLGARLGRADGERFTETVPDLWRERFGGSTALRYGAAFGGGAVMLFGARMAGGCTSGHGISGGLQLAVSSWTFFVAMFASGVAAAFLLFGHTGRSAGSVEGGA
jgi:hypothetical protein